MPTFLLTWGQGVTTTADDAGDFIVQGPVGRLSLRKIDPRLMSALQRIKPSGEDDQRLADLVYDGGNEILQSWYYYLERLTRRGLLCQSAHKNGVRLATLIVISPSYVAQAGNIVANRKYVLSRFALLRRDGTNFILESPLSLARVLLNDCRTVALIAVLAAPLTPSEATDHPHGLSRESVDGVLSLLLRTGMLQEANGDGVVGEDQDHSLQTWSFHDLLFHARSRKGRSDAAYGGTYRFTNQFPPPPAIKPPMGFENHELYRPDLEQLERDDPPFARVQEQRRSIREFDSKQPITVKQISEFLFRVARAKNYHSTTVPTSGAPVQMDFAPRPYPSGGGLYEIEFYIAVQKCDGLNSGLYHYAPDRHVLERLSELSDDVNSLLRDAAESTTIPQDELQVLIILGARIPRLAWKYESIAYSLVLKHVGVIYQSMYLAATAMGLAPCAVGGGDADLFARAARMSYAEESSVGEFLLGSARPELSVRDQSQPEGER